MITDKDIIIELLRQREDLQAKLSAMKHGLKTEPYNPPKPSAAQMQGHADPYELDMLREELDKLKKKYEALEYQRDDFASLIKECNFTELRKLLNIPEGETLSTQLVKKVQEIMIELANAKHASDGYRQILEERKAMYESLKDSIEAKNPLYKGKFA